MTETLIIGAGPAGLTAAYELTRLGRVARVLEQSRAIGGISRTASYRGNRFDIGGHRFFTKMPEVSQVWRELMGDDLLERERLSRILYNNKFFHYPLRPVNALLGLGVFESLRVMASYARARFLSNSRDETFEDWVCKRFGRRLFEIFFKTYTEKVWGIPCSEIGAEWASQRIKNLSLGRAVLGAFKYGKVRDRKGGVITTLIDSFLYPRLGPGQMWERCRDVVAERGTDTVTGARVVKVRHARGRVVGVDAQMDDGSMQSFGGDEFLSTMPIRELFNCFDPQPPAEVLKAANLLRYRDFLTVVLIVNRPDVFPDNWIYVHSADVQMGRIQNYKNWSPEMVADKGCTTLGLEYFVNRDSELWHRSEDGLVALGASECVKLGLIEPDEVLDGTIVRAEHAYPVYDRNYAGALVIVREFLSTLTNLQSIGRNGQHRYNNQDHSMLTGMYAARNLAASADYDIWSVNTDPDYQEEGRLVHPDSGGRSTPRRLL